MPPDLYLSRLRDSGLAERAREWLKDVPVEEYAGWPSKWAYAYAEMPTGGHGLKVVGLAALAVAAGLYLARRAR